MLNKYHVDSFACPFCGCSSIHSAIPNICALAHHYTPHAQHVKGCPNLYINNSAVYEATKINWLAGYRHASGGYVESHLINSADSATYNLGIIMAQKKIKTTYNTAETPQY